MHPSILGAVLMAYVASAQTIYGEAGSFGSANCAAYTDGVRRLPCGDDLSDCIKPDAGQTCCPDTNSCAKGLVCAPDSPDTYWCVAGAATSASSSSAVLSAASSAARSAAPSVTGTPTSAPVAYSTPVDDCESTTAAVTSLRGNTVTKVIYTTQLATVTQCDVTVLTTSTVVSTVVTCPNTLSSVAASQSTSYYTTYEYDY